MSTDDLIKLNDDDQPISFREESIETETSSQSAMIKKVWKILIVDDEPEIHRITKMVLRDYTYKGYPFLFFSAYSRKEATELLSKEDDIALVLLDVVMESDDAGLLCVKDIRETLNNLDVRIILRTGQPGQAPEQEVIVNYDINDYKLKTDMTSKKLFTAVIASLRTYQYITILNHSRRGLERIITATGSLFEYQSFSLFASGILEQMISILELDESSLFLNFSCLSAFQQKSNKDYRIVAATGKFSGIEDQNLTEAIPEEIKTKLFEVIRKRESRFEHNSYIGYFENKNEEHTLLYLTWQNEISDVDLKLITLFVSNVSIAFEKILN